MRSSLFYEKISQAEGLIIYGAGMVGGLVYKSVAGRVSGGKLVGFAVTKRIGHAPYMGEKVYGIEELRDQRTRSTVIIATLPGHHEEIERTLKEQGFSDIVRVDEELYEELSGEYIAAVLREQELGTEPIDVVCMASDNNSTSGAFLCMAELLEELKKRGVAALAVLPEYGSGESLLQERGIAYTYLPSEHWAVSTETSDREKKGQRLKRNVQAVVELETLLRKHSVKLVHNNTTYTYVGAEAAKKAGIPVVWHLRENIREQGYEFENPELAAELMNASRALIAVSKYLSGCYQFLRRDKLHIVYDGVEIERYYEERDIFREETITIVAAGVVMPLKGQEDLIEAAKGLKEEGIDFQIWIIGNGDPSYIRRLWEQTVAYGLQERVAFLGKQENIGKFYKKADIAVVCSRAESFGRVTVEAQLAGCLVAGAAAGATPELLEDGETGLLYPPGSGAALKEKISWAARERARAVEIARNGQRQACRRFSKEENAGNIYKIYQEILGENA